MFLSGQVSSVWVKPHYFVIHIPNPNRVCFFLFLSFLLLLFSDVVVVTQSMQTKYQQTEETQKDDGMKETNSHSYSHL